jgi:hypothetical protein
MALTLCDFALAYAQRGLRIFPCRRDKRPIGMLVPNGCHDASSDAATIKRWWSTVPKASIGCATGNGLMVVDVDMSDDAGEESGETVLRRLEAQYGALPPSVEAISGSGGRHIYLRYPEDRDVRNSAGRLGENIDVRANGGYVVLPPSPHESGRCYAWSTDTVKEFAPAPQWLLDLLDMPRPSAGVTEIGTERAWTNVMRDGLGEGQRNDGLTRLVGYWLQRIGDPSEVLELAKMFNLHRCRPPLPESEIEAITNSIAGRELAKRTAL